MPAVSRDAVSASTLKRRVDQALGRTEADLVIKNTRYLDVATGTFAEGDIAVCGDAIVGIGEDYRGQEEINGRDQTVVPGFVDAHVHVESSLLTPEGFDSTVLPRGTTTAICDPHEIANVLGAEGIRFFLDSALETIMDLRVMLPSCVPATHLETAGAVLGAEDLLPFKDHPKVLGLAEMMNFPGLLHGDPGVMEKVAAFSDTHIDGHSPLVRGKELNAYLACGIRTCHESTSLEEAREKLSKGMRVLMREGSVSKDVAELAPLLTDATWPFVCFCTDDRNPLDIAAEGHIDHSLRKAIAGGVPVAAAYRAVSWSAANAFGLTDRGMVAPGYRADLLLLDDVESCAISQVIRNGSLIGAQSFSGRQMPPAVGLDSVKLEPVSAELFRVPASGPGGPVIGAIPGSLLTEHLTLDLPYRMGERLPDPIQDVQKICVLARHGHNGNVGRGFVQGFGLTGGALASSVGHDSHNICVVGVSDTDMAIAANRLIALQGGFVAVKDGEVLAELALPVAGLMTTQSDRFVEEKLKALRAAVADMGCRLEEPFLQLAFLPLPVIPHLKITDFGLVDVDRFELIAA
ncbi:MAG: adenine deaminase [Magnetospiraceae bacterium]